jgi:acetyltransferase
MTVDVQITRLAAHEVASRSDELVALLRETVDGGASIGFMPPLSEGAAHAYWESVAHQMQGGSVHLLIATDPAGRITGSVQLHEATRANGTHRAEVAKLMVLGTRRRGGIGRVLMNAVEALAAQRGRTTLVLDTRQGDPSERLYQSLGWTLTGYVPAYARSADGRLHTGAFYHRLVQADATPPAAPDAPAG